MPKAGIGIKRSVFLSNTATYQSDQSHPCYGSLDSIAGNAPESNRFA